MRRNAVIAAAAVLALGTAAMATDASAQERGQGFPAGAGTRGAHANVNSGFNSGQRMNSGTNFRTSGNMGVRSGYSRTATLGTTGYGRTGGVYGGRHHHHHDGDYGYGGWGPGFGVGFASYSYGDDYGYGYDYPGYGYAYGPSYAAYSGGCSCGTPAYAYGYGPGYGYGYGPGIGIGIGFGGWGGGWGHHHHHWR